MKFTKLEALGNDFILIDARSEADLPRAEQLSALADRRRGIGFDQALVLLRDTGEAGTAVRIFNSDGSEAEQCGNGMRAIAAWFEARGELGGGLRLNTCAGPVRIARADSSGYLAELPGVRPLQPELQRARLPEIAPPGRIAGLISLGNPHLVIEWPKPPSAADLASVSEQLSRDPECFGRTNIGLAATIEDGVAIALRVDERGAGPTPACGSGACAAALLLGRAGGPVRVDQPGGSLVIDWAFDRSRVRTTGPARLVFHGSTA